MKKVLVAMSGGVDSAAAALILKNQGLDVAGITMKLIASDVDTDKSCADAKRIADDLNISHHIVSYYDTFKEKVINSFLNDYRNGNTPNPCVVCNKTIKFGKLWEDTKALGYSHLATGHYARILCDTNGEYFIKKAKDEQKDQSYFLWGIRKEILPFLMLPLGDYTKQEIRALAEQNGFVNAKKKDSQDICFINNGDYAEFIRCNSNCTFQDGDFIDINGHVIGKHKGIINYTIGQRKGLEVAFGVPMFVGKKDALKNTVTLCSDEQLYGDTLTAKSINLFINGTLEHETRLLAKIRYRHTPAIATVKQIDCDTLSVKFDIPQRAIASGQSLVLYDGDTVIGGGIIQ